MLKSEIKYFLFSKHKKGHGVHSPFLFNLITQVFNNSSEKLDCNKIELIKNELIKSENSIQVKDYGAGSKIFKSNIRKVSEIAKYTSVEKKYGRLLYRLAEYFQPETILELGTSLGISGSYLAMGNNKAKMVTIEGCNETARIAQKNFQLLNINNIILINGTFEEVLPLALFDLKSLGIVLFDGNHTLKATVNYFNQCVKCSNNNSLFIFDDIHWSEDMEKAWEIIKENEKVTLTVDILKMGLVFFKKELQKQNFIVRF